MASLTASRLASRVSAPARSPRAVALRVPRTVVYVQQETQQAEGFVEKDSAGQSNLYPTIIKPFEAGSAADTVEQESFNTGLAVATSAVALGAIGLGLVALLAAGGGSAPAPVTADGDYLTLSAYAAKFEASLAPSKPAPAPVPVPAPALEAAPEAAEAVPEAAAE